MIRGLIFQFQRFSLDISSFISSGRSLTRKMPFYAVARGRSVGIYQSWGECESQVKGFSGARYKKFDTSEAAQNFITSEGGSAPRAYQSSFKPQHSVSSTKSPNNNLKRSYSTSSNQNNNYKGSSKDDDFSDDSDDLMDIVVKQMDDIEKRVNSFSKGLDKLSKKGTGRKAILIEPEMKRSKSTKEFREDSDGYVQVYTDGACSANGTQAARAGLGVYWGDGHELNTSEPVSGRATNNCGEIQAATRAIRQALANGITKLAINTDSKFLIDSVTKWMPGWKRKGWKLKSGSPVKNEVDFKELDSVHNKLQIKWNYVEAHKGIHGNEMADQLARAGAALYEIK